MDRSHLKVISHGHCKHFFVSEFESSDVIQDAAGSKTKLEFELLGVTREICNCICIINYHQIDVRNQIISSNLKSQMILNVHLKILF